MAKGAPPRRHGVMEAKGFYNQHSRIPAGGLALALPHLQDAVRNIEIDCGDHPLVIADLGSSQGKNSLAPMSIAIASLRQRAGVNRPILVYHVDQPANDFNTLFEVLATDPDRYTLEEANVFPCAIGRSFYESVFPPRYVHLAWCSYAAMWLSRIPSLIPDHFIAHRCVGSERAKFDLQAAEDWKLFLSLRAGELRTGGRLVVVLAALDDKGASGFESLFDHANAVLANMATEGFISSEERRQMVVGVHPMRRCDLLSPFQTEGLFEGLRVESCDLASVADGAWAEYERDGDAEALATKNALFFRSVFVPSLALHVAATQNGERRRDFADRFSDALKKRLVHQPAPLQSFVHTLVLSRNNSAPMRTTEARDGIR
jgi:SAM dependent carboxyl methyltransferase